MAKATLNEGKIVTTQVEPTVTLELSLFEAKMIKDILGRFVGAGSTTDIFDELKKALGDELYPTFATRQGQILMFNGNDNWGAARTLKYQVNEDG